MINGPSLLSTAAESSSDESFVSNASSLLLDTSKQHDNNAELLEGVISALASNPKYSGAKKKQAKKKKNSWQMGKPPPPEPHNALKLLDTLIKRNRTIPRIGILSRKKKKKAAAASSKPDNAGNNPDTSATTAADSSVSPENDTTSASDKAASTTLERTSSVDKLNDTDPSSRSIAAAAEEDDDEDITKLVCGDALIGYTATGGTQDKYQCLLCTFYRKNIVQHYKQQHPRKEVLISRLPVNEALLAIEETKAAAGAVPVKPEDETSTGRYSCRFCTFLTKGVESCARESFYEHCTNHTGEYRYSCSNCGFEGVARGTVRSHFYKECKKYCGNKTLSEAIVEEPLPGDERVYGYLCGKCNFVQLKRANVERHVRQWHAEAQAGEIGIVRIDMSLGLKREEAVGAKVKNEGDGLSVVPSKVELKDEKVGLAEAVPEDAATLEETAAEQVRRGGFLLGRSWFDRCKHLKMH